MNKRNKVPKKVIEKTKKASPRTSKNRDHFQLLITDLKFQDEIKKVREKLGIPLEGFTDSSDIEAWAHKKYRETDEILDSEKFRHTLSKINKDFKDKKINSKELEIRMYKSHLILPVNYEVHAVRQIIKNFNLPENYEVTLRSYLVNNGSFLLPGNFSISYSKEKRSVSVNIYTRLTDKDLRDIKNFVNTVYKDKLPNIQNLNNMDKKLAVESLSRKGYEIDVVTGEKYKLTDKDIAERVFGDATKKSDVYETKRGLERLRKSRFTKRKTVGQ